MQRNAKYEIISAFLNTKGFSDAMSGAEDLREGVKTQNDVYPARQMKSRP